uniref:Uncharacterized protein n=1 Tax=Brassica oleracea TaxID=3712 RepID=A0A3P6B9Y4_BRAOL|nr:unnamed protein product [Brassica oleracea]
MDTMLQHTSCQHFVTDCKDTISIILDPKAWSSFEVDLGSPMDHGLTKHSTMDMVGCGWMDQEMNNS